MKRESNFELLRILCILGIIVMHSWGMFYSTATGINLVSGVFINSLFNTCVSVFILISGYYGIKYSKYKLINFEITLLTYSMLSFVINYLVTGEFGLRSLAKSCLPFSSGKYWYMTVYMLLLIFSGYINKIPEALSKKQFEKLIILLMVVFSILPTVVQAHVMDDGGKGFANMFLMYLIGRYIRMYWSVPLSRRKAVVAGMVLLTIEFALNYVITYIGGNEGVIAPFARDCSLLIILLSICIFELFRGINIQSDLVNRLAKHVIAVYLLEAAIRGAIFTLINPKDYVDSLYLVGLIFGGVASTFIVCVVVDICRIAVFEKLQDKLVSRLCSCVEYFERKLKIPDEN